MDPATFEQVTVSPATASAALQWVVENQEVQLLSLNGVPASVEAPNTSSSRSRTPSPACAATPPRGATKQATLETASASWVPLFIVEGERVRVDTRTGGYITRV